MRALGPETSPSRSNLANKSATCKANIVDVSMYFHIHNVCKRLQGCMPSVVSSSWWVLQRLIHGSDHLPTVVPDSDIQTAKDAT